MRHDRHSFRPRPGPPRTVLLVMLAASPFAGCQGHSAPPDPWLQPPPEANSPSAGVAAELRAARPLDPSIVRMVLEPFQDEAEQLLAERPWVQLTVADAGRLAGWADAPEPDHLYLLRGVELPSLRSGRMYVTQSAAADVLVEFDALTARSDPGPTRRQPVVVMLDRPPRNVYVVAAGP